MQDVLKCSRQEIFQQALEKMHPNLNQAFAEAGTPAVTGLPAGVVGGTPNTVIAAMSSKGQARLHKVIRSLSGIASSWMTSWQRCKALLAITSEISTLCSISKDLSLAAENGHLKELTTGFYGNYTLQDLLDASHKLRQAAAQLRARGSASQKEAIDQMLDMEDGTDALGAELTHLGQVNNMLT